VVHQRWAHAAAAMGMAAHAIHRRIELAASLDHLFVVGIELGFVRCFPNRFAWSWCKRRLRDYELLLRLVDRLLGRIRLGKSRTDAEKARQPQRCEKTFHLCASFCVSGFTRGTPYL